MGCPLDLAVVVFFFVSHSIPHLYVPHVPVLPTLSRHGCDNWTLVNQYGSQAHESHSRARGESPSTTTVISIQPNEECRRGRNNPDRCQGIGLRAFCNKTMSASGRERGFEQTLAPRPHKQRLAMSSLSRYRSWCRYRYRYMQHIYAEPSSEESVLKPHLIVHSPAQTTCSGGIWNAQSSSRPLLPSVV